MKPEDQDLNKRVARLEKELAEIKLLLGEADKERQATEKQPSKIILTPPPIRTAERVHRQSVSASGANPQGSEPDKVRIFSPKTESVAEIASAQPEADKPLIKSDSFEFRVGGLYLAYAGGLVVLLGMLYLVTLMISNRWITLEMQWGGELVFCSILAGLGLWKLNSKEAVGQVLVGTGSCGAFLSFAGAHVYKDILSLDGLIAACLLLSFANFAFSEWRRSQAFYVFGILGGFAGAFLALPDRVGLSQLLCAFVLLPAVVVVVRRQWQELAVALWLSALGLGVAGLACLSDSNISLAELFYRFSDKAVPAALSSFTWVNWFAYSLFSLAASAACLLVSKDEKTDRTTKLLWVGPTFAALVPYTFLPNLASSIGFFAVLGFGLVQYALAGLSSSAPVREGQKIGALLCILFVPAFSLSSTQAGALYALEALGLAVWWLRSRSDLVFYLSTATGILGWLASFIILFERSSPELVLLTEKVLSTGSGLVIAAAAVLASWPTDEGRPLGRRAFTIFAAGAAGVRGLAELYYWLEMPYNAVIAWAALTVVALLSLGISFGRAKEASASFFFFVPLAYVGLAAAGATGQSVPAIEVLFHSILIVSMVLATEGYARLAEKMAGQAAMLASLAAIYPFARLAYLACTTMGADSSSATAIGAALYTLLCSAIAGWRKWPELNWSGVLYALCIAMPLALGWGGEIVMRPAAMASSFVTTLALALTAITAANLVPKQKDKYYVLGLLAGSVSLGRFSWLVMTGPGFEMQSFQALLVYFAIAAGGLAVFSINRNWKPGAWLSTFYMGLALAAYPFMKLPNALLGMDLPPMRGGVMADAAALAMLLVSSLLVARALLPFVNDKRMVQVPFIGLEWTIFSGLIMILAQQPPLGIKFDFSMSAAWVIYGVILLVIGFVKDSAIYRISGLVVFFATLCKVFLYDLSYLETVIKIILLISFGLVMLAISFAYTQFIRIRQKSEPSS